MKRKRKVRWILAATVAAMLVGGLALVPVVRGQEAKNGESKLVLDGSTTVGPIAKAFKEYYTLKHKGVSITVSESGSGNGAKSLINQACDIANMSRFMKDKEFKAAVDKGVFPVAHVVALDGIAVIVHKSNPVKGLSVTQAREIYTGKISNWKDLGGPDQKIVAISRDTNSGTYETFHKLVMKKQKMAKGVEYVNSNGMARARVQKTRAAIAYVGLAFNDRTVKGLEIDGILPSKQTVQSGTYPIARPLFMFTNGYPKMGSHKYAFVTLHLSKRGQEIIEAVGFVPVTNY
jgi:phosphate transport system substrate-binding protein